MQLLADQVQRTLKPKPTEVPERLEDCVMNEDTFEDRWRRIVLRAFLVISAANLQATLLEITSLEPRRMKKDDWEEADEEKVIIYTTKAAIFARAELERSKSLKNQIRDTSDCSHRELLARGGRTYWWTCRHCGKRWPRVQGERLS